MSDTQVRVRMAPSPTGYFHVGSARTALFNFLLARHTGGTFVLRIEDTDQERSLPEYEQVIYDAMEWLGLSTDEGPAQGGAYGPYRQSERFEIYREWAAKLIDSGQAYYAYETAEELAEMRQAQAAAKQPPRYNGAHRDLTPEQRAELEAQGRKGVVRLRIPEGETTFVDAVYGSITWKNADIDDFVIVKSEGGPTYNFACVIDDALMKISHVIRGEDGLSNTPRQALLYRALGLPEPVFAHLPFLLGTDRKKLSKRNAATVSLMDFKTEGIFPDAMFNYLSLLGWNPGEGETQEIFSREELIKRFSLEGVNKAGAIFDADKMAWMNVQYLKSLPIEEFQELAAPYLSDVKEALAADPEYTRQALAMARERIHGLADIASTGLYFFTDEFDVDAAGATKHLSNDGAYARMAQLREALATLPEWTAANIEGAIRDLAATLEIKPAELIHPCRLLVSGRTVGPSLWELLEVLGRERVLRRLEKRLAN